MYYFLRLSCLALTDRNFRIATILKNPSTDPACKTTLIVAPLALLDQWKAEIEERTNCGMKCLIYHGKSSLTSKRFFPMTSWSRFLEN